MARCEDCIHAKVCDNLISHGLPWNDGKYPAEKWCDLFKSTADVAPRAEIDKLQEVNADLNESLRLASELNKDLQEKVDRWRFGLEAVLEERAEDRAEVAREIFEEIEKHLFVIAPIEEFDGWARIQLADIMRLKKKYTEPEPPKGD